MPCLSTMSSTTNSAMNSTLSSSGTTNQSQASPQAPKAKQQNSPKNKKSAKKQAKPKGSAQPKRASFLGTTVAKREVAKKLSELATFKKMPFEAAFEMMENELKAKDFAGLMERDKTKNNKDKVAANAFLKSAEEKFNKAKAKNILPLARAGLRLANWAKCTFPRPDANQEAEQKEYKLFSAKLHKVRANLHKLFPRNREQFRQDAARWLADFATGDDKKDINDLGDALYQSYKKELEQLLKPQDAAAQTKQPTSASQSSSQGSGGGAGGSPKKGKKNADRAPRLLSQLIEAMLMRAFAEFNRRDKAPVPSKTEGSPEQKDKSSTPPPDPLDEMRVNILQKYARTCTQVGSARKESWKLWTLDEKKERTNRRVPRKEPSVIVSNAQQHIIVTAEGIKTKRQLSANTLIFWEQPIAAKWYKRGAASTSAYCGLCYHDVSRKFVPCTQCRRAVFCSELCGKVARCTTHLCAEDKQKHCADNVWHKQLNDAAGLIYQLVDYAGGSEIFDGMLKEGTLEKVRWTVKLDKLTQATSNAEEEDQSQAQAWRPLAVLMSFGKIIELVSLEKDRDFNYEPDLLVETYHLAQVLKETYSDMAETLANKSSLRVLYMMVRSIRQHQFCHQPIGRVLLMKKPKAKKEKAPAAAAAAASSSQESAPKAIRPRGLKRFPLGYALGAFGGLFGFSCDKDGPNVYRRLNLANGKIEYIAHREVKANQLLAVDWDIPGLFEPVPRGKKQDRQDAVRITKEFSARLALIRDRFPGIQTCACDICKEDQKEAAAKEGIIRDSNSSITKSG